MFAQDLPYSELKNYRANIVDLDEALSSSTLFANLATSGLNGIAFACLLHEALLKGKLCFMENQLFPKEKN